MNSSVSILVSEDHICHVATFKHAKYKSGIEDIMWCGKVLLFSRIPIRYWWQYTLYGTSTACCTYISYNRRRIYWYERGVCVLCTDMLLWYSRHQQEHTSTHVFHVWKKRAWQRSLVKARMHIANPPVYQCHIAKRESRVSFTHCTSAVHAPF